MEIMFHAAFCCCTALVGPGPWVTVCEAATWFLGGVAERPIAPDCGSGGVLVLNENTPVGSNPTASDFVEGAAYQHQTKPLPALYRERKGYINISSAFCNVN
jgi:hypothetical protein